MKESNHYATLWEYVCDLADSQTFNNSQERDLWIRNEVRRRNNGK